MNPMEQIQQQIDIFILLVKKGELGSKIAAWPDDKTRDLCIKLIKEESKEMLDAIDENNWPEIIDGAADTIFVVLYAMSKAGIRLAPYWEEVCRTNLAKAGGPIDEETGKQLKPEGWKPPRIEEMLQLEKVRDELLGRVFTGEHTVHKLKTQPEAFNAIRSGDKTHEWRQNDRRFEKGDILVLQSYDKGEDRYLGHELICAVTWVTREGHMLEHYSVQISPHTNWVVMSVVPLYELDISWSAENNRQPWREYLNAKAFEK